MYRFFLLLLTVTLLRPYHSEALSCAQESLAERIERASIVARIVPDTLITTNRSNAISSNFTWSVLTEKTYKGSISTEDVIVDKVWPGMPETQTRLESGTEYLVFLNSAKEMDLCDYPRSLDQEPLTSAELTTLQNSNQPSMQDCSPYVCRDGTTYASCTDNGTVINYFAPPCHANGGEVGSEYYPNQPINYTDVNDFTSYVDAIAWATNKGVVEGYADGTFRPNNTINRAEFLKILLDPVGAVCRALYPYPDVDFTAWYGDYVQKASCTGLAKGDPSGTFRPAANINTAEAAKIIVKHHSQGAVQQSNTTDWYTPFVSYLQVRNALPLSIKYADQFITRAEMVEMMYRLDVYDKQYGQAYSSQQSSYSQEAVAKITEAKISFTHPSVWGTMQKNSSVATNIRYTFPRNAHNPTITAIHVPDGTKQICNYECITVDTDEIQAEIATSPDVTIAGIPMRTKNYYDVPSGVFVQTYVFYRNDYEVEVKYEFNFPAELEARFYTPDESLWDAYLAMMGNSTTENAIDYLITKYPSETKDMQRELNTLEAALRSIVAY